MSKKNTVIVVAYPDRGEGNDPAPFFFFFLREVGSLLQPKLNIFTVDNLGVMICLGQGGLRSLSASSLMNVVIFFWVLISASDIETNEKLVDLIYVCLRVHRFIQNKERLPSEHSTQMMT